MKEEWRDIPDWEGLYQASNLGKVKSLSRWVAAPYGRKRLLGDRVLSEAVSKDGYLKVVLCKNSIRKGALVHRLVALAFIANPENKPTVNHKNGLKKDNSLKNLEWNTIGENSKHACDAGLKNMDKVFLAAHRATSKSVKNCDTGETYSSTGKAARKTGICRSSIGAVCNGKYKTAGGFRWSFVGAT